MKSIDIITAEIAKREESEAEICRQAGLSPDTIRKARDRGSELSLDTIKALCTALDMPLMRALGETPAVADTPSATPIVAADGGGRVLLAFDDLVRSDINPRKDFGGIDAPDMQELADSIEQNGVMQNLLVRPARETDQLPLDADLTGPDLTKLVIVFGERRHRAIELLIAAGKWDRAAKLIPAVVRPISDDEHLALALLENLQRKDMNPLEEAEAFQRLNKLDPKKWSTAAIAKKIGFTQRHVQIRMRFVNDLIPAAQAALRDGKIKAEHARVLMVADPKLQERMLKDATDPEDPADPKDLRYTAMRGWVHAKHAIFPVEEAEERNAGEVHTDDETGERWFIDGEKFRAAQEAAAHHKALDLQKQQGLAFVRKVGYFDQHQWTSDKKNPKAGVVYVCSNFQHEVKFKVGYRQKTPTERHDGSSRVAGETKEEKAKRQALAKASEKFDAALAAIVAKDGALAVRILVLSMFTDYNDPLPFITLMEDVNRRSLDLPAKIADVVGKDGGRAKGKTARDLVKGVMALTDNQALALIAQGVASQVNPGSARVEADSLEAALYAAIGVEVPPELLPDQADIEDAAPKSKKKAAE